MTADKLQVPNSDVFTTLLTPLGNYTSHTAEKSLNTLTKVYAKTNSMFQALKPMC